MTSKNYACFIIGALAGFVTGALFMKDRYKKIADEEVASVIQEFSNNNKVNPTDKKTLNSNAFEKTEVDHIVYNKSQNYSKKDISQLQAEALRANYDTVFEKKDVELGIEQITEDEFGNEEDPSGVPYRRDTLFYYTDDVLANSDNDKMPLNREIIGRDFIEDDDWKNYGDALYFRNHHLHMDIEVLRSLKSFEEIKRAEQFYEEE